MQTAARSDSPACATAGRATPSRKRGVVTMTLLCGAHCSLALLVPVLAIALSAAGVYVGLPLPWIVPPFLIAGAFLYLTWPSIQGSWAKLREGPSTSAPAPSLHPQEIQA